MEVALVLNGVFEEVLEEIISAQKLKEVDNFFLQPYSGFNIRYLKRNNPSEDYPIQLFISPSNNLNNICYTAQIVGWQNKMFISEPRFIIVDDFIKKYQPKEGGLYKEIKGKKCVNLISIKNLVKLETPFSTSLLTKISNQKPLKKRTQSGHWSYVELPVSEIFVEENILAIDLEKSIIPTILTERLMMQNYKKSIIKSLS